jgi:glycosyltransferase involved in cell wall biosynthesis
VVLCHTYKQVSAVFVGMLAARRAPRLVVVEHQPIDLRTRTENLQSALALPFASAVVVLSPDYRDRYPLRWVPLPAVRRTAVIPNGVDTGVFSPALRSERDRNELIVGMASRLIPTKDVESLIRAVGLLQGGERGVRLEIAGDGTELDSLESLVDRLDLRKSVTFLGHLAQDQLLQFLRGLDVYVQSTKGETMSTAVLQAYAIGLPLIGSAVTGVRDLVRHGVDGLLVEAGSAVALAEALADLAARPARMVRLGRAARTRAVEEFSAGVMAQEYRRLLHEIDPTGPWRATTEPAATTERVGKK